ncbi:hypothetical protein [Microbacterium suwonense]|uniref:Lipoprotein n=1 Tax=Microbacterium suwonense TaxID=683047 RepID=A0ABN6X734_9MICO|nr:hypothetical protein [Microbacterium suwonense]BDZ39918.1 hypothetical protein GCM10025863_25320 [Microbacterium suwonense]
MTSRAPALASLALAALLLSGCTATQSQTAEPTPAPEETQIPEEITGQPGDPLTAEEAKQLNGQRGTLRPYEKSDGSYVIIDVKQPLPEPVKQEVAESIGSVENTVGSSGQKILEESASTGKTIILVRQLQTSNDAGQNITTWASMCDARGFPLGIQGGSAEAVIAQIQPWVDSQRDPGQYEIIVVNN